MRHSYVDMHCDTLLRGLYENETSIYAVMRNKTTVISHRFRLQAKSMLFIRCYPGFSLVILLHI